MGPSSVAARGDGRSFLTAVSYSTVHIYLFFSCRPRAAGHLGVPHVSALAQRAAMTLGDACISSQQG